MLSTTLVCRRAKVDQVIDEGQSESIKSGRIEGSKGDNSRSDQSGEREEIFIRIIVVVVGRSSCREANISVAIRRTQIGYDI